MSYDDWKLRGPEDERGYYDEPCDHAIFEIDIEGRAHCDECPHSWWASASEIETSRRHQREYDRWCRAQERRELWRKLTWPIRWPIFRLLEKVWPRKSLTVLTDDEIPF